MIYAEASTRLNGSNTDAKEKINELRSRANAAQKNLYTLDDICDEWAREFWFEGRRRMTQAAKASVDEVLYVPAALALHQRPAVPGIRSTFGTGTELLNSLRLMFSRLSSYPCPQCGHWLEPSLAVAAEKPLLCPQCGASVRALPLKNLPSTVRVPAAPAAVPAW